VVRYGRDALGHAHNDACEYRYTQPDEHGDSIADADANRYVLADADKHFQRDEDGHAVVDADWHRH